MSSALKSINFIQKVAFYKAAAELKKSTDEYQRAALNFEKMRNQQITLKNERENLANGMYAVQSQAKLVSFYYYEKTLISKEKMMLEELANEKTLLAQKTLEQEQKKKKMQTALVKEKVSKKFYQRQIRRKIKEKERLEEEENIEIAVTNRYLNGLCRKELLYISTNME
jgi:hypothetical protein